VDGVADSSRGLACRAGPRFGTRAVLSRECAECLRCGSWSRCPPATTFARPVRRQRS